MIHQVCPNPELLQQLYTGPLGAHVDTFAQQMLDQGYASSTAKYAMRVLAAFSTWLQRQDLTATDLNEQQVEDFLHDHPWRSRPRRSDRAVLGQLIAQLLYFDFLLGDKVHIAMDLRVEVFDHLPRPADLKLDRYAFPHRLPQAAKRCFYVAEALAAKHQTHEHRHRG